jgi:ABC-2 type transport system ATP-binding protein
LRDLDRSSITLDSIEVHRPTLDDVFLTLTGRSLRDAEDAAEAAAAAGGPDVPDPAEAPAGSIPAAAELDEAAFTRTGADQ